MQLESRFSRRCLRWLAGRSRTARSSCWTAAAVPWRPSRRRPRPRNNLLFAASRQRYSRITRQRERCLHHRCTGALRLCAAHWENPNPCNVRAPSAHPRVRPPAGFRTSGIRMTARRCGLLVAAGLIPELVGSAAGEAHVAANKQRAGKRVIGETFFRCGLYRLSTPDSVSFWHSRPVRLYMRPCIARHCPPPDGATRTGSGRRSVAVQAAGHPPFPAVLPHAVPRRLQRQPVPQCGGGVDHLRRGRRRPRTPACWRTSRRALFILPFFLFSALSGQLADKYEKIRLIRQTRFAEVVLMCAARWRCTSARCPRCSR